MKLSDKTINSTISNYALKLVKPNIILVGFFFLSFLILILAGIWALNVFDQKLVGLTLLLIGTVFTLGNFRHLSTRYEVNPNLFIHKGKLTSFVRSRGRFSSFCLILDEFNITLPNEFEVFGINLSEKLKGNDVEIEFCVLNKISNNLTETFYIPIRIEDDFCIEKALKKYGENMILIDTLYSISMIFVFVSLLIINSYLLIHLLQNVFGVISNDLIVFSSIFASIILSFYLTGKINTRKRDFWEKRLSCKQ